MADAFAAAIEQWPRDGVPQNPRAWLVSAGRFKAIDAMRRQARFDSSCDAIADQLERESGDPARAIDDPVEDDRLRLIFTCCHPALAPDAQVAMTLREVCGLTTEEIAAFTRELRQRSVAVPLDPETRVGGDEGTPITVRRPDSAQAQAFRSLAAAVTTRIDELGGLGSLPKIS